jgi:outer membrane protein assembly factor BamB
MKKPLQIPTVSLLVLSVALAAAARDWPQWRGPERNSLSRETGLLQQWPGVGPRLLWAITNVGAGYSTPSVVGERFYLLGNEGLEHEFVAARAVKDGQPVWATRLGKVGNPQQQPKFPAARSTPTVDGKFLYALSSDGDLACLETGTGKLRWRKNLRTDFGGKPGTWAYAESPLVDGEHVICTPGGTDATLVALDKKTGALVWKCPLPEGDEAAYASAILVQAGGVRQCVQFLQKGLVGVDAKTGKFLWRYSKPISRYGANVPSPLASDVFVYVAAAGTGAGVVQLKKAAGGVAAEPLYFEAKLPAVIGGAVKVGDRLYGTTTQALICADFATGKVKWEAPALGAASLCHADGRLYLHGENGEVALVEPAPDAYREQGRFTPPNPPQHTNPTEKAWAYPVVANGRLYLRDQGTVWCYDVKARK